MTNAISIGDILQRQVQLEWYEAVALAAELCAALPEPESAVPPPEDVLLSEDGSMTLLDRGARDESVVAIARMLNALLAGSAPPAPLRLFVLHAISAGSHKSPKLLGDALAYYERPGRSQLLQEVYQRYLGSSTDAPHGARMPLIPEEPAKPAPPKPRRRHLRPLIAATVVALLICAGIAVWASTGGGSIAVSKATQGVNVGGLVARVSETARSIEGAVRKQFGLPSASDEAPAEAPKVAAVTRPRRRATPTPADAEPPEAVAETASATIGDRAIAEPSEPSAEFVDESDPAESPVAPPDPSIYSSYSWDVQPAILIDPIRLPPSVRVAGEGVANAMELFISEDGTVQRVRMLSPPQRMPDVMLLSAAKNWKFEPAVREGRPVKYRLTYSWVSRLR